MRSTSPTRCPDCGAPLERRSLGVTGEHGTARVSVERPALVCLQDHRFHVHPDFGARFIEPFVDRLRETYRGALPQGARRRLRRRPSCPGCGQALPRDPVDAVDVDRLLLDVPEVGPVEVRARVPSHRCSGCGQQVGWWPRADHDLVSAVTASIEAAGIRHLPRFGGRRPPDG